MAALKQKKQINLLPSEDFKTSIAGRVLSWLMGTFRYIVIVTELLVMAAFLSRFWLDAKSNDLNEQLDQKTAIITSSADFEKEFRKTQSQLNAIASVDEVIISEQLALTTSFLPQDVILTSFSLIGQELKTQGISASERSIAQFIANLESNEGFENVTLSQLATRPDNQALLEFVIKSTLKQ